MLLKMDWILDSVVPFNLQMEGISSEVFDISENCHFYGKLEDKKNGSSP